MPHMRPTGVFTSAVLTLTLAACGGTATVDRGAGGGTLGTGSQGGGGTEPLTCSDIVAQYAQQLQLASICDPAINGLQCTDQVVRNLPCGCPVYVNPANSSAVAEFASLSTAYQTQNCTDDGGGCPPCVPPMGGYCEQQPPGSMVSGVCVTL